MKFDKPAGANPTDTLKVLGKPTNRYEGPLKTTGTAPYAYEQNQAVPNAAYGYVLGAAIAKGIITSINLRRVNAAPGVLGSSRIRTSHASAWAISMSTERSLVQKSRIITRRLPS